MMRQYKSLLIIIIISSFLVGCSDTGIDEIYGEYRFKETSYLSPLSSSSIDSENMQMEGVEYIIKAGLFRISHTSDPYELIEPVYVKEKIPDDFFLFSDVRSFIGKDVECQYTILMKYGYPTHKRIYVSSDRLWIALFADNTADGSEIIMNIYELTKK